MSGLSEDLFWSKVNKDGPTVRPELGPCWIWTGGRDRDGYGVFSVKAVRQWRAHRLAYELVVGPVPVDILVCHRCDVKFCVNWAHLFLGTPAGNSADMVSKSRQARGEVNGRAKLSEEDVHEIRAAVDIPDVEFALRFGVTEANIRCVRRRLTWRHVP